MIESQTLVTGLEIIDTVIEAIAGIELIMKEARVDKELEVMEQLETGRTTKGVGPEVLAGRPNVLRGLL